MLKLKKKFVTIRPKSDQAADYFDRIMLGLQSCELLETQNSSYLLKPIRARQTFWVHSKDDVNWEIEK